MNHVYAQTNDAGANALAVFSRADDGTLSPLGTYATGGRGNGKPHLPSQGSVATARGGDLVLVANAGSDDVTAFAVAADGISVFARVDSGGRTPTSVAVHDDLVYVLNNGDASVAGFRLGDARLMPIADSRRDLGDGSDPAQAAFTPDGQMLVVTLRGTDEIAAFAVGGDGRLGEAVVQRSAGATPYGFDFTRDGLLVVTEAFGGELGKAAASSYSLAAGVRPISESVGDTRSEVCWAVVSPDGRFAYVTNFGDGTISSYELSPDGRLELRDAVAGATVLGEKGVRDEALTPDGRFLYALDADARKVFGWRVGDDGSLAPLGAVDGLPATVAGLAAA